MDKDEVGRIITDLFLAAADTVYLRATKCSTATTLKLFSPLTDFTRNAMGTVHAGETPGEPRKGARRSSAGARQRGDVT